MPLFGELLLIRGVISQGQLDEAIRLQKTSMQGVRLGEILLRLEYITQSDVTACIADQVGIPNVRLSKAVIPEKILRLVHAKLARRFRVVPIGLIEGAVVLATADVSFIDKQGEVEEALGEPVRLVLTTPQDISEAINKYY
jgi:type IV pilus assembly protein PilB